MKTHHILILATTALLRSVFAADAGGATYTRDALDAFAYGAKIRIALHVVDSTGRPVEGAEIDLGVSQRGSGHFRELAGRTDANGDWAVEARCSSVAKVRLQKNGYYETRLAKALFSTDYADVNRRIGSGRWTPWEQTVVLKEQRHPTALFLHESRRHTLPFDRTVGFDFQAGALVVPFGTGTTADVSLHISTQLDPDERVRSAAQLHIVALSADAGLLALRQDANSRMKSVYHAPTNGYERATTLQRNRDYSGSGMMYDMAMGADDYIVFRVRVEKDAQGKVIKSRYGKIYALKFGDEQRDGKTGYVLFDCFLNPSDNDTNLEWDGTDLTTGRKYAIEKVLRPL